MQNNTLMLIKVKTSKSDTRLYGAVMPAEELRRIKKVGLEKHLDKVIRAAKELDDHDFIVGVKKADNMTPDDFKRLSFDFPEGVVFRLHPAIEKLLLASHSLGVAEGIQHMRG